MVSASLAAKEGIPQVGDHHNALIAAHQAIIPTFIMVQLRLQVPRHAVHAKQVTIAPTR